MDFVNEEQQVFIGKLEKVQEVFREIKEKDKRRLVIQHKNRDVFEKLIRDTERIVQKLTKHEFTVAVVGLEKAGKSTLANALLKLIVLPEYTERCTYTTTEIRAGSSDTATIYFYDKNTFDKNFRQMLKDVEYPADVGFEDLNIGDFERYWQKVKNNNPALFQQHNGTTIEDIKAMLDDKSSLDYLTGKEPEILDVNNEEDYEKLYRYITGIEDYRDGHVERVADPYAVEKVVIKSTGLTDMKNIVLYDVPGFDSPTELHKKQTEDMLKMSDAIILVTNVGDRPNLTGTQLDMLQKGRDEDGISLSDKVFVFGNKLDMAGNVQLAKDNYAALVHDAVDKYSIAKRERIVCGSAKSYLESHGKLSQDDKIRGGRNISATLQSWGISDGIEDLKSKMQKYYDEDRFIVLKRRAEKNITDVKNFLTDILSKYNTENSAEIDDGSQYLLQSKDFLYSFAKKAAEISREYINQMQEERPFSSLISEDIENIFPNESADSLQVVEVENTGTLGESYALSRIDSLMREKLAFNFRKNIVTRMSDLTLSKEDEIYQKLAEIFLQSLKMEDSCSYRNELEENTKNLFKSLLAQNGERCYFNPLIERYMLALLEILIKSPYASSERLKKLIEPKIMLDIQALSTYYPLDNFTTDYGQKYFFAKLLTHEDIMPPNIEENEEDLRAFFDEYNANLAAGFDIPKLPFRIWAVFLTKLGVKVSECDLLERMKKALINFVGVDAWSRMSPKDKNRQIHDAVIDYCTKLNNVPLVDYVQTLNEKLREIENKAEMIEVLNDDIEILRDFTLNAAIQAIGLERAFNSIISKNIDIIRESIDDDNGQQIINKWLKENMRKIRESEYSVINDNLEKFKIKKAIAESILQVLSKLEN